MPRQNRSPISQVMESRSAVLEYYILVVWKSHNLIFPIPG